MTQLGLKKPPAPRSANEEAKKALGSIASMLGESFMFLNEGEKERESEGLDYSMIALPTIDMQHVPQHQRPQHPSISSTKPNMDSRQIAPITPYQASIIPFWSTPITANSDPQVQSQPHSKATQNTNSVQDRMGV